MVPIYSRIAAIDDDEDHLQKIAWGLGKAGFCPIAFRFEDGKLENPPDTPLAGIRLVFSDIHMIPGGANNEVLHASNIINCLKKIVGNGPYALIFWSRYPDEVDRMRQLIEARAPQLGLTLPLGYGRIDKNSIFNLEPAQGAGDDFNPTRLRELILEQVGQFHTLGAVSSWDERVATAAAHSTNQLFSLAGAEANRTETWEKLLAYLACEASGFEQTKANVRDALDAALLPLLEDQLTLIGREPGNNSQNFSGINRFLDTQPKRPGAVDLDRLNSSYLIEEILPDSSWKMSDRGVVTQLKGGFINSGEFMRAFGLVDKELILREFALNSPLPTDAEIQQMKLHLVEIGAECDHVQGKVSTHRYLLALLVPLSLKNKCINKKGECKNASILDSGSLYLKAKDGVYHLLISCRCFMSLAPAQVVDGAASFRLRKDLMNEVVHNYTTHARRPGVMRFYQ